MEKYIDDIIEIILEDVSCDHQVDSDGVGKIYDDVSYSLKNEQEVMKKCLAVIPAYPVKFTLKVDGRFIQKKTQEMIEIISKGKMLEAMSFIRSLINEISEKINLKGDEK